MVYIKIFLIQYELKYIWNRFSSVQLLSRVRLFATPRTTARQASLPIANSRSLFKLKSIESVIPSNHLILCRPLLLPPSICPSIRVFWNESVLCIRWPKYWRFGFSISPSNEYSGLISFRMDWFGLLPVQGPLKRLLQHHSSKALECKVEQKCQKSWSKEEILKVAAIPLRMAEFQIITLRTFHYFPLLLLLLLLSHFSRFQLCVTPWTATHQAPMSMKFSRQEYWSGLPFPSPFA